MKLQELTEAAWITKTMYGPAVRKFGQDLPQFAEDKDTAEALASYSDISEPVTKVVVTYKKPADNKQVEAAAKLKGLDIDWSERSFAQEVATNTALRDALRTAGFDAYADASVLENTEPFQIVVFDAHRIVKAVE